MAKQQQIPLAEILCWTASLQRDESQMYLVAAENTRRPLFPVVVHGDKEIEVGTAYNFKSLKNEFYCTVAIDQALWRTCIPSLQEGCAVYAGPFKIIGGCDDV